MSLIGCEIGKVVSGYFFSGVCIPFGCRPTSWWLYDSPGPRRLLSGDPNGIVPDSPLWRGIPKLYRSLEDYNAMKFESQPDYLRRHRLLMKGEAAKIKPELIRL